jgi:phage RecT family recombinase
MAEQQKSKNALITMVDQKKEGMWQLRATYMPNINMEVYFKRALIDILQNNKLVPITKTEVGISSIMNCIVDALQLGLQIGGTMPQAYIVPFKDKNGNTLAELIPTAVGYKFICITEPNKVMNDFSIRAVYDGEDFSLDYGAGTVKHTYDGKAKLGKLIGVYCIIVELNDKKRIEYMNAEEIEKVRNNHSSAWKAVKDNRMKKEDCAWFTDPDAQYIKTAAKRFLKPYAAMKEGLAMALAVDDGEVGPDKRPIEQRVGTRLDDIIDADYETTGELGDTGADEQKATPQPAGGQEVGTRGGNAQGPETQGAGKKKAPF